MATAKKTASTKAPTDKKTTAKKAAAPKAEAVKKATATAKAAPATVSYTHLTLPTTPHV